MQTLSKPGTDYKLNVSGTAIVLLIVAVMVAAGGLIVLFKPEPISSVEVARMKQSQVFTNSELYSAAELQLFTQDALERYIDLLNYIMRIGDSLSVIHENSTATADSEYTLAEANQRLVAIGLSQREQAARAMLLKVGGRNSSPVIDSLYELVHRPMPEYPKDSTALKVRNLTIERYDAIINN